MIHHHDPHDRLTEDGRSRSQWNRAVEYQSPIAHHILVPTRCSLELGSKIELDRNPGSVSPRGINNTELALKWGGAAAGRGGDTRRGGLGETGRAVKL